MTNAVYPTKFIEHGALVRVACCLAETSWELGVVFLFVGHYVSTDTEF